MSFVVNIDIDDLQRGIEFYGAALGLSVGRRFGHFAVELLGSSTPIYLLIKAAGTAPAETAAEQRTYERHWTPVHLDFIVETLEPAVTRALAAGARLEKPITTHEWGRLALMADPFGHGFCFVELAGRGYDAIAD